MNRKALMGHAKIKDIQIGDMSKMVRLSPSGFYKAMKNNSLRARQAETLALGMGLDGDTTLKIFMPDLYATLHGGSNNRGENRATG